MWQKSKKLETSKQQNCSEKIFIICFLNHIIVILEELITIVILKKGFVRHMCFLNLFIFTIPQRPTLHTIP
jgi:hypothetical protein